MPLVAFDRIQENIPGLAIADEYAVSRTQAAVEATIEKFCGRRFASASYDELYHGSGTTFLHLTQRPIISVQAIRYGLLPGLLITNSDQTTYNATVTVNATGLVLARSVNGVTTSSTLTYAAYTTFTAMATAITALGNGWTATVGGSDITGWVSSDLSAYQGTFGAWRQTINILFHRYYVQNYRVNDEVGEISCPTGFPSGYHNIRVAYTAGYATIPDDIQNVVCELTRTSWQAVRANSNYASESLGGYSYSLAADRSFNSLSAASRKTLELYRSYDLAYWR